MDSKIKEAADKFVETLSESPDVHAFQRAQTRFDSDDELSRLRTEYAQLVEGFQAKQLDGTYTNADVEAVRVLQQRINTHPTTTGYVEARNAVLGVLGQCNAEMSNLLGFDFAATAAPAGAC